MTSDREEHGLHILHIPNKQYRSASAGDIWLGWHSAQPTGSSNSQTPRPPFVKPGRDWIGTMTEVVVVVVMVDVTTTVSARMSCLLTSSR